MHGNGQSESLIPDRDLFRIGEVSRLTATKQFVLRYWETEFPMLQPVKSPKGHRLYRREDVDTVLRIKRLLYDEGFTIAGARRHLRDQATEPGQIQSDDQSRHQSRGQNYREERNAPRNEAIGGDDEASARTSSSKSQNSPPAPILNRKMLLDLRDSLRSFLTLLERE